jgi:predicted permease
MTIHYETDDLSAFEAKETSTKLPVGWVLLFWGLVIWGVFYLWAYTPALGGWSQSQDLEAGGASSGTNLFATILFTALPTAAAILIALGQRRKKPRAR